MSFKVKNINNEPVALMSALLVDILVTNDDIKGFADKISIRVGSKTLEILQSILAKSPESLVKIVSNLQDILTDGLINHKDIPNMIILVSNLYKTDLKSVIAAKKLTSDEIIQFILFMVKLVIDLDFIRVENKVEMYKIIEASGALLEMIIPASSVSPFSCFRGCFSSAPSSAPITSSTSLPPPPRDETALDTQCS
jgi:hypothetical protein